MVSEDKFQSGFKLWFIIYKEDEIKQFMIFNILSLEMWFLKLQIILLEEMEVPFINIKAVNAVSQQLKRPI